MRPNPSKPIGETEKPKRSARTWNPLNYLVWLQSRREHTRQELKRKLEFKIREKELEGKHDVEAILDKLIEYDLQSDQRFLDGKVRQATRTSRGPGWVRQKLYGQGLESEAVSQALSSVDDEEWEREAYHLAQRRFGVGPYTMPLRLKAGNFLIRRGYSIDLARKITGNVWPPEFDC